MFRIDSAGNVANLFSEGNPSLGQRATKVSADWLNASQEELCNLIEAAGVALVKGTSNQMLGAVLRHAGGAGISVLAAASPAKGDGTTDDTAAIQAIINANKGKKIVFPPGTYLVSGLSLSDSTYNGTQLICAGGVLKHKADGGSTNFGGAWVGLIVGACSGVVLDTVWDGNRSNMTATEHVACIGIAGASNLRIPSFVCSEIRGDGITIGQSNWLASSTDPTNIQIGRIVAINSADDGRNAISFISCRHWSIDSIISFQVGGVISATTEPGGIDLEPDFGYQAVTDGVINGAHIVTAGTCGFQILGKSISGVDASRDWNVQRITARNILVTRTGTSGAGLAAANLIRASDCEINASVYFSAARGTGWQLDFLDRLSGKLRASGVATGIKVGPVGEVRDFDFAVGVSNYSLAGLRPCQTARGKFTGRISNSVSVASSTPFAIQTHNEGGTVTQTATVYAVDCPYDGVNARAFRNESSNPVTFNSACKIRDCDYTGYSAFNTCIDDAAASPFKAHVAGLETTAPPTSGRWVRGEFVPNTTPSPNSGGATLAGWTRATTGTGQVLGTDWVNSYFLHQPTAGLLTPSNGGTVTPDPTTAQIWEVDLGSGVATATIATPAAGGGNALIAGQTMDILIWNNASGGSSTVTFGGGFRLAGGGSTVTVANNKMRGLKFYLHGATGAYVQMGGDTSDA